MKYSVVLMLLVGLISSCVSTGHPEANKRHVTRAISADGHEFHFMPINEKGVTDVTIMLAFPTRWAYTQGLNQAAPFVGTELIMNGETQALKPQDIMELFNDKNARGAVYARPDHVIGQLDFPIEYAADIVPVASELLAQPVFEQRWIERIKQTIRQNSQTQLTQTNQLMFEAVRTAIIKNQPLLQNLSIDSAQALDTLTDEDLLRWHGQTFTQAGVTVAVTGALTEEQAGRIIDSLLVGLPKGEPLPSISAETDFTQRTVLLHVPDAEKTTLALVGELPPGTPQGDMSDLILLGSFARGGASPLFDALRTQLRATYGFQAGYANYNRDTKLLFVSGELETDVLAEAVDVALDTYANYRQGNTLEGYQDMQVQLEQGTAKNLEFVSASAQTLLELAIDGLDTQLAAGFGPVFDGISLPQLTNRLAEDYPGADELLVVAASADANALPGACVIGSVEQIDDCKP